MGLGGILTHEDVAVGGGHVAHVAEAGALLQHRIVAAGVAVHNGLGGGHQQALGQLANGETGLFLQTVLPDVLRRNRGHTGNLGRSHGGTGHDLIGVGTAQDGAVGVILMGAVDGVDVTAGGGDLGLQFQGAGNAPGAEIAHGVVIAVILGTAHTVGHGHGAGVVQHVALVIGHGGGGGLHGSACGLGDGDCGSGLLVVRQVHVDDAGLVVTNDGGNGAGSHGELSLLIEGDGAAGAEGDLTGQSVAHGGPVFLGAEAVDEHILVFTGQGSQRLVGVIALVVNDHVVANGEVSAGGTVVVDGGHGQGVGEGAGGTVGLHAHVIGIQVAQVIGAHHPGAGVTGGHADHGAGLGQAVQDGLVGGVGVSGHTGVAGAQRQVDGIGAQDDGVLDGGHVVGVVSAAALTEHLHGEDLRVGGHALDTHLVQSPDEGAVFLQQEGVGGGDAFHVGAMLTTGVVDVVDAIVLIDVVVGIGNLGADIGRGGVDGHVQLIGHGGNLLRVQQIQALQVFLHGQAAFTCPVGQGILERLRVEGLVAGVDTGIDHGDTGTGAGVALSPGCGRADLLAGGGHIGVIGLLPVHHIGLIPGLDQDLDNAGDLLDGFDLAVLHIGGNNIGSQCQVPDHVQLTANGSLDGSRYGSLPVLQLLPVAHGLRVLGDALYAEAGPDGGLLLQNDGYTDHVGIGVGLGICRVFVSLVQKTGRNRAVVHLREGDLGILTGGVHGNRESGQHGKHQQPG